MGKAPSVQLLEKGETGARRMRHDLSRRAVLKGTCMLGLGLAVAVSATGHAVAAKAPLDTFMTVSAFLTGRTALDITLGARFLDALSHKNAAFAGGLTALASEVDQSRAANADAFIENQLAQNGDLKKIATAIVSAWYLGFVGVGKEATLICYEDALMYDASRGLSTIPTYCGGEPDYWASAPDPLSGKGAYNAQ